MAHQSLRMAWSVNPASPARFAGNRLIRTRLDVLSCKLGAKAKQQLSHINALEPVGVPV